MCVCLSACLWMNNTCLQGPRSQEKRVVSWVMVTSDVSAGSFGKAACAHNSWPISPASPHCLECPCLFVTYNALSFVYLLGIEPGPHVPVFYCWAPPPTHCWNRCIFHFEMTMILWGMGQTEMLWFECEIFPITPANPYKAVESWGGGALLKKVGHQEWPWGLIVQCSFQSASCLLITMINKGSSNCHPLNPFPQKLRLVSYLVTAPKFNQCGKFLRHQRNILVE